MMSEHARAGNHGHDHPHSAPAPASGPGRILTVRATAGLSGDMMLAGLIRMNDLTRAELEAEVALLGFADLQGRIRLEQRSVNAVNGWSCAVDLPCEHEHRSLADIRSLIGACGLSDPAKQLSLECFSLLAGAEGAVHGKAPEAVHFHEVGALDSVVDICLVCSLFCRLRPERLVCSPLPLADVGVRCAHGWLPTPAPAVLQLLEGIPVCGFAGRGETVTPTALALLKTLGADFGPWPDMLVHRQALVYGTRIFPDAPNGAIWACGPERRA
jgi:uncharacterized protein (DUF111 family)